MLCLTELTQIAEDLICEIFLRERASQSGIILAKFKHVLLCKILPAVFFEMNEQLQGNNFKQADDELLSLPKI